MKGLKGLTFLLSSINRAIEEGYCNDALNLITTIESDDVKFTYILKGTFLCAMCYVRAGNKELAFYEIENCLAIWRRTLL